MRYLFTLLLAALWFTGSSQIKLAEYFIDDDPGFGKGTRLVVPRTNDSQADFNVPLANLSAGIHSLNLRTLDERNRWSHTSSQTFIVQEKSGALKSIARAEYFLDTDPGLGKGTAVAVSSGQKDATIAFIADLKNAALGIHTLYLRSQDNLGVWSHSQPHTFYIGNDGKPRDIVALKYNFSAAGFESQFVVQKIATPGPDVTAELDPDLSKLPGDAVYSLNVYAIASDGNESFVKSTKVKICNGAAVKANYDFVAMGTEVSFIDSTANALSYRWDFGDGKTDTVSNPKHIYKTGGAYKVKLITSNFCNSDTLVKTVHVLSYQSSFPDKGGNTGTTTMTFTGSGFTPGTKVKLSNGSGEISGYEILVSNDGKTMNATFELYDKAPGNWSIVITGEDGVQNKYASDFRIEQGQPFKTQVEIIGRSAVRTGLAQKYTFNVKNLGNTDAKGIFLWVAVPRGTSVNPVGFKIVTPKKLDLMGQTPKFYFSTDTLFNKPGSFDVYGFILRKVDAGGSTSLDFELSFSSSGEVSAWTSSPTYGSPLLPGPEACMDAISGLFSLAWEGAKFIPAVGCVAGLYDGFNDLNMLGKKWGADQTNEWKRIATNYEIRSIKGDVSLHDQVQDYALAMGGKYVLPVLPIVGGAIWDCMSIGKIQKAIGFEKWSEDFFTILGKNISSAMNPRRLITRDEGKFVGDLVWTSLEAGYQIPDKLLTYVDNIIPASETGWEIAKCADWTRATGFTESLITIVGSYDPNEKVGPKGATAENAIQGTAASEYKIYFENKNTATAPAQEVIVIDTLDKQAFDLSTFQLKSLGFGTDHAISIPAGLKSYATHIDMRPAKNLIVRVDAKLDETKGILKWRFLSLDPNTMELTDDPLAGFLPPNAADHRGEGYISFSLKPKPGLSSGTKIENKSAIYFDSNPAIVTNTFINTIDKTVPVSQAKIEVAATADTVFRVSWAGTDAGSGIRSYDVFYSTDNGPWRMWKYDTGSSEAPFFGKKKHQYRFYSIAKDNAGNMEAPKSTAEAEIKIKQEPAPEIIGPAELVITQQAAVYSTADNPGNNYVWTVVGGKATVVGNTVSVVWERPGNGLITVVETDPELKLSKTAEFKVKINPAVTLPANNFTLEIISASCKGKSNGSILVKAAQKLNYAAVLTAKSLTIGSFTFSDELNIASLSAGNYELSISVAGEIKRTYKIVITEPADLAVLMAVNEENNVLKLEMSGAESYDVELNGKVYRTRNPNFELKLHSGRNQIKVSTGQLCQGVFEKTIEIAGSIRIYPNPVINTLNVDPGLIDEKTLGLELRDATGSLLLSKTLTNNGSVIQVDLSHLAPGFYIMRLRSGQNITTHKIMKQ